jgi:hypothetical protein
MKRIMASSFGKMGSIAEIVWNEHAALGEDLSMVILADYVRSEALKDDNFSKIGVVPIFQRIVKDMGINPNDDDLVQQKIGTIAVLTGKLKIIPKPLISLIETQVPCQFIDIPVTGYVEIKTTSPHESELVSIITRLMNEKIVNIIIGTAALLGEGWDCPAVNSLILASFVGSYMLSNQMRGRAIRSDKTKEKVANIWHLVSLTRQEYDRKIMLNSTIEFSDYQLIKRRFQSFLGIAYSNNHIQNGIERLDVINDKNLAYEYEQINKEMYRISRTRKNTKKRWLDILKMFGDDQIQIVHTLKTDLQTKRRFKSVMSIDIRQALLFGILFFLGTYGCAMGMLMNLHVIPSLLFGITSLACLKKLLETLRRLIHTAPPEKNMKRISEIVLLALKETGYIKSNQVVAQIQVSENLGKKEYETELLQSTTYENNLYIQCMREIYDRVDNPRYLIVFGPKKGTPVAYFSVPTVFADHKSKATHYYNLWRKQMGNCRLVYTRNGNGRNILQKARGGDAFSSNQFFTQQRAIEIGK